MIQLHVNHYHVKWRELFNHISTNRSQTEQTCTVLVSTQCFVLIQAGVQSLKLCYTEECTLAGERYRSITG